MSASKPLSVIRSRLYWIAVIGAFAVPAPVSGAFGQELKKGVRFGMTLAEIRLVVRSAHSPAGRPDRSLIDPQAKDELETESWPLEGQPARTRFFFRAGKLVMVSTSLQSDDASRWDVGIFRSLSEELSRNYGKGEPLIVRRAMQCDSIDGRWTRSPTTVLVSGSRCSARSQIIGRLSVSYLPTPIYADFVVRNHLKPLS